MPNNYPRSLGYSDLKDFLSRTWQRNVTGGGFRKVSASGTAHYMHMGEEGEAFIRISYDGVDLVDLTDGWVEIDLSNGVRSVPMIKLLNRVLEDNNMPYFVPTYRNTAMICYTNGGGTVFDRVITARYYHSNGRFTVLNGRTIPDYRTDNKEDN